MICLNLTPCSNCKLFRGIVWHGKEEKTEYIKCEIALDNNAKNLLIYSDSGISCDKQERKY